MSETPRVKTQAKLRTALASAMGAPCLPLPVVTVDYLAEHLANALVPSWLHERECQTAGEEIAHVLLMFGLFPPDWMDAYRTEILIAAGVEYDTCRACGAAFSVGKACGTCEFKARMAAEANGGDL